MIKYYVEFVDKNENCNFIMQSKWFLTQAYALKWLIKSFDYIDFDKFSIFIMCADFDAKFGEDGGYGDIELLKQITREEYYKLRGNK